jgi:hypothetical protein
VIDVEVITGLVKNIPLREVLMEVENYLNHPAVVCDYIRAKQPTTSEIYASRNECDKFPYAQQLVVALREKGHANPEVVAQEMLGSMPAYTIIVFYVKGLSPIKNRKQINAYLTALAQRLMSGGPDGRENVRDTFCMLVEEIRQGKDSHVSCMAAQWLFSLLVLKDRCVDDYVALLDVFNVLQQCQNGLTPVNYFLKMNQVFLQNLSEDEKVSVMESPAYVSLKETYAAQLRVKVEEESKRRVEVGSSLGSVTGGMYSGAADNSDGSTPGPGYKG